MKKKMLSLATVLCLGIGFVGGCNKDNNSFKKLTIEGQDIVLTVGKDSKYTADDLFSGMLSTEVGAQTAYEKILKMIVENSVDTDSNMEASWELLLDSFEEEVASKVASEGMSKKEARTTLLTEQGYSSISEKKEAYFYEVKLAKLQDEYWKEKKDYYFEEYLKERLPYYVKHILVNTGYTEARGPYNSIIDSDDANDLYDVYSLLAKGEKFSYVMNHKSEDKTDGTGYHMDLTTSFVPEFLHGVFVLDSLLKNKTAEVEGLTTDVLSYYVNNLASTSEENDYNFNVIYASDIETLGEKSSVAEKNDISTCVNDDEEDKETCSGGLSDSTAYGSASALYTRTIIFNQTFNNPGISVIALDEDLPNAHYVELTIDGKKQKFLADENDNLVFIACARGSSNYQVHFLTVGVSPFDENIKLFYSMDQEKTIDEMVAAKETALKTDGSLSETAINTQLREYKEELEKYKTYVDIMGCETQKGRNEVIEKLEATVKAYAQRGITYGTMLGSSSDNPISGDAQFLTYDMVEYYMDEGEVVIEDQTIKSLVESYITNQKSLIDLTVSNYISNSWDGYYNRVSIANSPEIVNKKIPMECAYGVSKGATCKFNYDEENGFEINITYKEVGSSFEYMPDDYVTSFKIGEEGIIVLPTAQTEQEDGMYREGYTFDGWYSTSNYEEGTEVTQIDATRSSTKNKVVVYAKWTKIGGEN